MFRFLFALVSRLREAAVSQQNRFHSVSRWLEFRLPLIKPPPALTSKCCSIRNTRIFLSDMHVHLAACVIGRHQTHIAHGKESRLDCCCYAHTKKKQALGFLAGVFVFLLPALQRAVG